MGTYHTSPSKVFDVELGEHLASHPELVGKAVAERIGNGNLPFLFKVLSIGKALSFQTHPDKATANRLHAQQPDLYKGVCTVQTSWSFKFITNLDLNDKIRITSPK